MKLYTLFYSLIITSIRFAKQEFRTYNNKLIKKITNKKTKNNGVLELTPLLNRLTIICQFTQFIPT